MHRMQHIEIDLATVGSATQLHESLRDSLSFPGWYGCNWDAFWDAITGLVEMPERLSFRGWPVFEERFPREAIQLKACLTEMSEKYPTSASEVSYG